MLEINVNKQDHELIVQIVDRFIKMYKEYKKDKLDIVMDIACVHTNIIPLRLIDLLNASVFDFTHDIFGIKRNLNRQTIKLENCFLPRFSQHSKYFVTREFDGRNYEIISEHNTLKEAQDKHAKLSVNKQGQIIGIEVLSLLETAPNLKRIKKIR